MLFLNQNTTTTTTKKSNYQKKIIESLFFLYTQHQSHRKWREHFVWVCRRSVRRHVLPKKHSCLPLMLTLKKAFMGTCII